MEGFETKNAVFVLSGNARSFLECIDSCYQHVITKLFKGTNINIMVFFYLKLNDPKHPVFDSFKSWNELANQAGISRIYGGIHWENSNVGGLEIGSYVSRTLFDKINWQGMNLRL